MTDPFPITVQLSIENDSEVTWDTSEFTYECIENHPNRTGLPKAIEQDAKQRDGGRFTVKVQENGSYRLTAAEGSQAEGPAQNTTHKHGDD